MQPSSTPAGVRPGGNYSSDEGIPFVFYGGDEAPNVAMSTRELDGSR
jgi:hypothetical protein